MSENTPNLIDLNAVFGEALIKQFFEPIITGRGPNGEAYTAPSGVALMAQALYKSYATQILDDVWARIDMDEFAGKIAETVVAELLKAPTAYQRNVHGEELSKRVKEIVAQQLGQRVVDQMDLTIGPKAIEE